MLPVFLLPNFGYVIIPFLWSFYKIIYKTMDEIWIILPCKTLWLHMFRFYEQNKHYSNIWSDFVGYKIDQ